MALPRAYTVVLREKGPSDGTYVDLRFERSSSEASAPEIGPLHFKVTVAHAADFALNTDYTVTFT